MAKKDDSGQGPAGRTQSPLCSRLGRSASTGPPGLVTTFNEIDEKTEEKVMEPIHIISLGAGVQSSTMVLMGAYGYAAFLSPSRTRLSTIPRAPLYCVQLNR